MTRLLLSLSICLTAACAGDGGEPDGNADDAADAGIERDNDVTYCHGAGDRDLRLDLARPAGDAGERLAVAMFVHGGGWSAGDRSLHSADIETAAARGYVAISIDYRLASIGPLGETIDPFPAQLVDTKCAIRWLRANAEPLGIDPDRIGVVGTSAGAHLSLLAGLTADDFFADAIELPGLSNQVTAIVNIFGPTDLIRGHETSADLAAFLEPVFLGNPADPDVALFYTAASPISYVAATMPPVLTMHGTADTLVPFEQGVLFDAAAQAVGADTTLVPFEGEQHGFSPDNTARSIEMALDFLDAEL